MSGGWQIAALIIFLAVGIAACDSDGSALDEVSPDSTAHTAARAVPDWAADAVFYQIFPERFRNGDPSNDPTRESLEFPEKAPEDWALSAWTADWYARAPWEKEMGDDFYASVFHRRYGGDLQGVLDELDYLDRLGVNALYFNPLFWARSLHKYDGNTYHHIDPYFGPNPDGDFALMTNETSDPASWHWTAADSLFLTLIREAHARGLRIVMDGVFNHTGRDFFAFADLRKNQQASPYKDWYIVKHFDDPGTPDDEFEYEGRWGVDTLPVFADTEDGTDMQPGPKQYIFDATTRWMDPNGDGDPSDGIDGWRLDVANEVPVKFWKDWNARVRELNPEAYTVSEVWEDARKFVEDGGFSATMNYFGFAFPVKGYLIDDKMPPSVFAEALATRREEYDPARQYVLQNLIDSHDTPRLPTMIVNARSFDDYVKPEWYDYDRSERSSPKADPRFLIRAPDAREREIQRLVVLFQMTYVGAPMIYYGDEAGMWGADDPDDRMPMVWPDLSYDPQSHDPRGTERTPDPVAFDSTVFNFYRQAIHLRRASGALRHGDLRVLAADDTTHTLAFSRTFEEETVVVVLNRADTTRTVMIPTGGLPLDTGEGLAPIFTTTGVTGALSLLPATDTLRVLMPARTGAVFHRTGIE